MPAKILDHNIKKLSYSVRARQYSHTGDRVRVPLNRNGLYKIWLIGNPCRLFVNDATITCHQPVLFFANPLVSYAYDSLHAKRSGYWCVFTKEFLAANDPAGRLRAYPALDPANTMLIFPDPHQLTLVNTLFRQLTAAVDSRYPFKNDMILNYIQLLVFEGMKGPMQSPPAKKGFTQSPPAPQTDAATRITRQFLQLLQSQFPIQSPDRPMPLQKPGDFARQLAIHVNHLNDMVRTTTGQTTTQHLAAARIAEAKALLRHSNWTIAAIGECLGFTYAHHFNRFFKKNTGFTPAIYRTKRIL